MLSYVIENITVEGSDLLATDLSNLLPLKHLLKDMLEIYVTFLTYFFSKYDQLCHRVLSRSIFLEIFVLYTISPVDYMCL